MVMEREMIEETLAKYVLAIFELGEGRAASCFARHFRENPLVFFLISFST